MSTALIWQVLLFHFITILNGTYCMHVCVWGVNTSSWAHALIFRLFVPYQRAWQGICQAWPALTRIFLYSKHTIRQKNIFICFPGGSHNGRYLFNKVKPCELQRLHWDGGGVNATRLFFRWFTLTSAKTVGVAVLHFLHPGQNLLLKQHST